MLLFISNQLCIPVVACRVFFNDSCAVKYLIVNYHLKFIADGAFGGACIAKFIVL